MMATMVRRSIAMPPDYWERIEDKAKARAKQIPGWKIADEVRIRMKAGLENDPVGLDDPPTEPRSHSPRGSRG